MSGFKIPSKPHKNTRNRSPDTPSTGTGLSSLASQRLDDYRRRRGGAGAATSTATSTATRTATRTATAQSSQQPSQSSYTEFKKRSNRFDHDNGTKYQRSDYTPSRTPARIPARTPSRTPSRTPLPSYSWDSTPSHHAIDLTHTKDYEEEQMRLDRDWYSSLGEESGVAGDSEHNPFSQYDDLDTAPPATQRRQRLSAKQQQFNKDNDAWETNRMVQSGLQSRPDLDFDFDDENESKVHVLVHDLKPPFLDGRMVFTKQLEPINPLRDPTSDLAVFARKGSALVRQKRAQAERQRVGGGEFHQVFINTAQYRLLHKSLKLAVRNSATSWVSSQRATKRWKSARTTTAKTRTVLNLPTVSRIRVVLVLRKQSLSSDNIFPHSHVAKN